MITNVEKILDNFGEKVITKSRQNLLSDGKKDTGSLYKSLEYDYKVNRKGSFEFSFMMEDYGDFVDKGVKGKFSSSKAPNSPFKFGSGSGVKGGLTNGINGWVKRKRFQFRKPNGKFMSYDSTAFLISRSIYATGLKTTNFFTTPFEREFDKLPSNLVDAYALDIDNFFKFTNKSRQ